MDLRPSIISTRAELASLAERAERAERVAVDLEANGRFAYRARLSTLQLAFGGEVAVVDPLAPELDGHLEAIGRLLSSAGPVKIIHDVGFDARLLAEAHLTLGNVHDTALLATWLGRPATGLASLALADLGVTLDKSLQAQDWGARPLTPRSIDYLANDVVHLFALEKRLWAEAVQADVVAEVLEETAYRIASGERAVREPDARPAFARMKGIEAVQRADLPVLRRVVMARESEAERLDAPAGELVPTAVLIAIARARPRTARELARIKSPVSRRDPENVAAALLRAVEDGVRDVGLSDDDARWLSPQKLAPAVVKARRDRDARLSVWRKLEAKVRGVHEQVVLPGHCATEIIATDASDLEALSRIGGFGAFRVDRYGAAILEALREPTPP